MNKVLSQLTNTIPRHLSGFIVSKEVTSPEKWNAGEEFVTYRIECVCGEKSLLLDSSRVTEDYEYFSEVDQNQYYAPFKVTCPECRRMITVFDPRKHGWDGRNGDCSSIVGQEFTHVESDAGTVIFTVSFQGVDNYEELIEEGVEHPEDYFDTFTIYFRATGKEKFQQIGSYECA